MLFCPFCREAFDETERCPDHDVPLVTLRELGQLSAAQIPDDQALPLWSARQGRGLVALGAVGALVGFFCPFGRLLGDVEISNTLAALARGRALRLWIVPVAALALLSMLYRRRSALAMRGARLGALFVSSLPSAVVAITWWGARAAAATMATRGGANVSFQLGWGSWLVFASSVVALLGSARLGVRPKPGVE
jgi:hypothetical protein